MSAPSDDSGYSKNKRWRTFLLANSESFLKLTKEQEAGWASPALDAWYQSRRPPTTNEQTSPSTNNTNTKISVFSQLDADALDRLCDRYEAHAQNVLASLFLQRKEGGWFLDLGAAPGGVSLALLRHKWRGAGVSLAAADGGIALSSRLSEYRRVVGGQSQYQYIEGSILDETIGSTAIAAVTSDHNSTSFRFDFVNGGAVQDHGQRKGEDTEGGGEASPYALPWFTFFAPQLQTALKTVTVNGSIMLVFGVSHCGSLIRLVQWLLEHRVLQSVSDVEVHSTIHPGKPPLYVMMHRIQPPSADTLAALDESMRRGRPSWWQLEEEDVFGAAAELWNAPQRCALRKGLEAAWDRTREFLEGQQSKAEAMMARNNKKRGREF